MIESTVSKPEQPALDTAAVSYQIETFEEDIYTSGRWFSILRTYALTIRLTLKKFQITEQQYAALLEIDSRDPTNPITIGALAARLGVRHNSAVSGINRLCEKGFVNRVRSGEDRRRAYLQLTEDGKAILAKLMHADSLHISNIRLELGQLARPKPKRKQPETSLGLVLFKG